MLKRVAFLGFSAVTMIAANAPGAAAGWEGPRYYTCYRSHCYQRYEGGYHWHSEYPRREYSYYHGEFPRYRYGEYPHYHYHYHDYPREGYVRYGGGYDPYDGGYYRYYSASRYDDRYYNSDW
jgi:hypothetical protein